MQPHARPQSPRPALWRRTAIPVTALVVAMAAMMSYLAASRPSVAVAAPPAGSTATPPAATGTLKIATASPARIFAELQEIKDLNALFESKTKNLDQERYTREQKLKELKAARDQLTPEAPQYADRDRELRQAAIDYDVWVKVNTADMQAERKRQMLTLYNKILVAVKEVATAKGLDLVIAEQRPEFPPNLDQINADQLKSLIVSQNVLFSTPQADISSEVIASMDAKYKSGK